MMKRVVSAVLAALLLASVSRAEEAAVDAAALEAMPGCEVFLDENGVDTVIRPAGQPFAGVAAAQDCELYAYLDGVEKPDEGAVFLRLTVALMTPEAVDAREMTLDAGGGSYVFKVTADTGEYDAVYYEDYAVCLTDESLPLIRELARSDAGTLSVTLAGNATVTGSVTLAPDIVAALYDAYVDAGGTAQDLESFRDLWPVARPGSSAPAT